MVPLLAAIVVAAPVEIGDANVVLQLDSVSIDYRALAHGPVEYAVRMTAQGTQSSATASSRLVLKTTVEGDRVVLDDEWTIMSRGFGVRQECGKSATLPLRRGTWSITRRGATLTTDLVVQNGTAHVRSGGREQEIPYPAGTVNQAALFRIIPQLPRDPGVSYVFDAYSEAIQIDARSADRGSPFHVNCVGDETIDIGGRQVACTKYTLFERRAVDYYVDRSGVLRRIVADGGQTVIDRR